MTWLCLALCCILSGQGWSLSSKAFFQQHVSTKTPVHLKQLLPGMLVAGSNLTSNALASSGLGAVSVIAPNRFSLMTFFLAGTEAHHHFHVHVHAAVKPRLRFPDVLRCEPFLDEHLHDSWLTFHEADLAQQHHRLLCLIDGPDRFRMEIRLQQDHTKQFDSIKAGDCLYLPPGWTVADQDAYWLSIRWKDDDGGDYCHKSDTVTRKILFSERPWPGEQMFVGLDQTSDKQREAFRLYVHIIDKYLLPNKERGLGAEDWSKLVRSDAVLLPELPHWNEECEDVARELFQELDLQPDGAWNGQDLSALVGRDAGQVALLVRDRVRDWTSIIFDMKVDLAPPLPPNPRLPAAEDVIRSTNQHIDEALASSRTATASMHIAKDEL